MRPGWKYYHDSLQFAEGAADSFRMRLRSSPAAIALAILLAAGAAGAEAAGEARPRDAMPTILLQPLGQVDAAVIQAVANGVRETFSGQVTVLPARPLPAAAFYRPRRRF